MYICMLPLPIMLKIIGEVILVYIIDICTIPLLADCLRDGFRDGLTEEAVRRYLMRKPMSSKDLAKAFKSKKLGLTNEQITIKIAEILKRIRTTHQKINGVVHFSIPG